MSERAALLALSSHIPDPSACAVPTPISYPDAPFAVSECKFPTTQANHSASPPVVNGTVGCLWGDAFGVINAASGHHITEGSWLRDSKYMDSYLRYFMLGAHFANGTKAKTYEPRIYTSWQVTAALKKLMVDGNISFAASLLPAFVANFQQWVREHRLDQMGHQCTGANLDPTTGGDWWAVCPDLHKPPCFYIPDGWDAMEGSVSGTGCRPSIGGESTAPTFRLTHLTRILRFKEPCTARRPRQQPSPGWLLTHPPAAITARS